MSNIGLSASELAQIRGDIAQLFPDTCSILQVTRTSDGAGGWSDAWGTATGGSAVPCRVDYKSGKESVSGAALMPYQTAIISMAHDATITPANRVQIGALVFSVQAVNNGQSWQGVTRVSAELVP